MGRGPLPRILYWTGGHPYLSQRLCQAVAAHDSEPSKPSPLAPSTAVVDRLCEELFLSPRARERDDNLLFVREYLLRSEADLAALLDLYARVRAGQRVRDDETNPLLDLLRLAGIVRVERDRLVPRSRIYARVFDREWVTRHMPDAELRRQRAAFRRGLARAGAVAGVVVALMAGLTGYAWKQRNQAKAERLRGAQLLYGADMQLAAQAWDAGEAQKASELLAAHQPCPGERSAGFDWRYQWRLLNRSAVTFPGHGGSALRGALAPDGHLITLDEGYQIRHWNTATRRPTRTVDFGFVESLYPPALSHDGRTLAVRTSAGDIQLFDTASGRVKHLLKGHGAGAIWRDGDRRRRLTFYPLAFSRDDRRLVSGGRFDGTLRVWDLTTGRETHRVEGLSAWANPGNLALSPDGTTVALGHYPYISEVAFFDVAQGEAAASLLGRIDLGGYGNDVAYSPDGKLLATSGAYGEVTLWDPVTRRQIRQIVTPTQDTRVAFSPDGRTLATGSRDALVKLWNVRALTAPGGGPGPEPRVLKGHTGRITFLAFSADGKTLATGSQDGTARLWDLTATGGALVLAAHANGIQAAAYSPDGRVLATCGWDPRARLWDARTGRLLRALPPQHRELLSVAFSPDGRTLATGGADSRVKLWDTKTGREGRSFEGLPLLYRPEDARSVGCVAFSPDGRFLAAGFGHLGGDWTEHEGILKIWDLTSAREMRALKAHENNVSALQFSPDGRTMVTASFDHTIKIWEVGTWQVTRTLTGFNERIFALTLSPDGSTVVAGGWSGILHFCDLVTGRITRTLQAHNNIISGLAFTADGKTLVSASRDHTVKLWDVASGRETRTLTGHTAQIFALAASPDGTMLASGDQDGTLRLWEAASWQEIDAWNRAESAAGAPRAAQAATIVSGPAALARNRRAAELALEQRRWPDALPHLERLIGANPSGWRDRVARGHALFRLNRQEEAEAEFARAAARGSQDPDMWIERGAVYALVDQWDQAAADMDRALALGSGDAMVWYRRALDRLSNSDNDAYGRIRTRLLARVLARKPADPAIWLERGHAYGDLREWRAAAADFTQAIRRKPADAEARLARGRTYAEMGQWGRAATDLAKAIDLRREATTEDWQIGYEHALARLGAGDLAGYRSACARSLARFGKSDDPDIAWSLATAGAAAPGAVPDPARAVRLAEKAVAGEGKAFAPFWHYRATLALSRYRAGQYDAAIRKARESIAASPEGDCGANWLLLAMAHYRLGHADEARRWLAKGLRWRPDASRPWHERLRFELLRREAQALSPPLLSSPR